MIALENEKIALDVRSGSFCIYKKSDHSCLSSGDVDGVAFNGNFKKMSDWAKGKFIQLAELEGDK